MASLLVKARREGREIVRVTPQSAGWKYVGFAAYRLPSACWFRLRLTAPMRPSSRTALPKSRSRAHRQHLVIWLRG